MNEPKRKVLARRERQIMDVLYKLERGTVGEVLAALPERDMCATKSKGFAICIFRRCRAKWRDVQRCGTWWKRFLTVRRKRWLPHCWAERFREFHGQRWNGWRG